MTVANLTASIDFSLKVKQSKQKLLDLVPGALVAYSLYPQSSRYTGPLFNIRRSIDNAAQDFYGVGDGFPYQAFTDFIGGGSGFLTKMYDQTGSGQVLSQPTAASQ